MEGYLFPIYAMNDPFLILKTLLAGLDLELLQEQYEFISVDPAPAATPQNKPDPKAKKGAKPEGTNIF